MVGNLKRFVILKSFCWAKDLPECFKQKRTREALRPASKRFSCKSHAYRNYDRSTPEILRAKEALQDDSPTSIDPCGQGDAATS